MDSSQKRPFHETIVDAIRSCPSPSTGEIFRLFRLIRQTKIPKGHDEIVAAIDKAFDFPGSSKYAREVNATRASVLAQKVDEPKGDLAELVEWHRAKSERELLEALLFQTKGDRAKVAEALQLNLSALNLKIRKHKLDSFAVIVGSDSQD
ncbi:MAG: helix-turn-helix domain-containing protein [bacterium]